MIKNDMSRSIQNDEILFKLGIAIEFSNLSLFGKCVVSNIVVCK